MTYTVFYADGEIRVFTLSPGYTRNGVLEHVRALYECEVVLIAGGALKENVVRYTPEVLHDGR